jgi:hypothetical protein
MPREAARSWRRVGVRVGAGLRLRLAVISGTLFIIPETFTDTVHEYNRSGEPLSVQTFLKSWLG